MADKQLRTRYLPEHYRAAVLSPDTPLALAKFQMPFDVAAVVDEDAQGNRWVTGVVTTTDIYIAEKNGATADRMIDTVMEPIEKCWHRVPVAPTPELLQGLVMRMVFKMVCNAVKRVLSSRLRDDALTEVMQKVFAALSDGKFDARGNKSTGFAHWIRTVANNKVTDILRPFEDSPPTPPTPPPPLPSPSRLAARRDYLRRVLELVNQLPEKQRAAIEAVIQCPDFSGAEYAGLLQCTPSQFYLNLYRGRQQLRKLLTESEDSP